METIQLVKELHAANKWATETLINIVPENLYYAETKSSFSSINATFNHLWDAQMVWYNRLTENPTAPLPSKSFEGNHTQRVEAILQSYEQYIVLLADKTNDYLTQPLTYKNLQGLGYTQPNYQILMQLTHHSAMHRGQVITQLRQLGFTDKIPQTDVVAWYRMQ